MTPILETTSQESVARHLHDLPAHGRKAHIVSLGCPKNLVDTERYMALLDSQGYSLANSPEEADLILVNTCGFIDNAKTESIDAIIELGEGKRPGQSLVVAGCLVDRYRESLVSEFPEVDLWLDLPDFGETPERLARVTQASLPEDYRPLAMTANRNGAGIPWASFRRVMLTPRHASYLKISEGCDHSCSFCAIPSFKGNQRSVALGTLVAEAEALARNGVRELTLIGQDTVAYGRDLDPSRSVNLRTLLERLSEIENLRWLRVLYTYPTRLAEELEWAYLNLPKMVPYLDLPLQHLSDPVLERMRRGTPYESIREHILRLRSSIPSLVIRSTCIVGFPGEGSSDFKLLRERFEELEVDHLGVFRYSDEEGTRGFDLDRKVPARTAAKRHQEMFAWSAEHCQGRARGRLGEVYEVLVDGACEAPLEVFPGARVEGQWWRGRWYGQAPEIDGCVYFQGRNLKPGGFVGVRLESASYPDYLGTPLIDPPEG